MAELPNCTGKEAVAALIRLGYRSVSQSGSRVRLKYPGRASLTVPVHHGKGLAKGTLRDITGKLGFTVEEFEARL